MTNGENYNYWLNKLMALCSSREFCEFDIKKKLSKSGLVNSEVVKLVNQLKSDNFISEDRYVRAFIHDKLEYQKWGVLKIRQALVMKKIPMELIQNYISEIDVDEYNAKAVKIAQSKIKSIKAKNEYEKSQKLIRHLVSKGFSLEDSFKAIKTINLKIYEDE